MNNSHASDNEDDSRKHIFGVAKVNDKGQITLPKPARDTFNIRAGDSLLVLGDEDKGIAIVNLGSIPE